MPCIRNYNKSNRNEAFNLIKIIIKVINLVKRNNYKLEIGILY